MPGLDPWIERILAALRRARGARAVTMQAFLTERGPVLTEVNPRFGGGFPLALAAGRKYPLDPHPHPGRRWSPGSASIAAACS